MNILLLDDEGEKLRYISRYLKKLGHNCEQVNDVTMMEMKVSKKKYDVVIVDIIVPIKDEEIYEDKKNGLVAIEYLRKTTDTIFYPKKILVLSRYLDKDIVWKLNALGTTGIKYENPNGKWQQELKEELDYISLLSIKKADIVILTVVDNEKSQLHKVYDWERLDIINDPLQYYYCDVTNARGYPLTLVHCFISKMGVVAASQATGRVIELFEPDCIIMCGIAGGRKKETNFGDIIVAESAVDFASGSVEENSEGEIDYIPDSDVIGVDPNWIKPFKEYKEDISFLRNIRDKADSNNVYKSDITLHIGRIATGPAVIKSEIFSQKYIRPHNRKYIAIDMETYGVYYTARNMGCKYISIKTVSDNADCEKNDIYQKYAALISANLVKYYIYNDYKKSF